tara:strand:- start:644 stop:814 length:171 start_codon:yes stop_codon:yes gene_type:complete
MISYYITLVIGTIFGYFLACLMMMAKGNAKGDKLIKKSMDPNSPQFWTDQEDDGEY